MTPPTAEQVTAALAWFRAHPAAVDCIGADMPEPYADDHAITLVRAAVAAPAEQPREIGVLDVPGSAPLGAPASSNTPVSVSPSAVPAVGELSQAIPPTYTEWLGGELLAHVTASGVAA
jgi:hypothetical protein